LLRDKFTPSMAHWVCIEACHQSGCEIEVFIRHLSSIQLRFGGLTRRVRHGVISVKLRLLSVLAIGVFAASQLGLHELDLESESDFVTN
jgi:hypothetical protein